MIKHQRKPSQGVTVKVTDAVAAVRFSGISTAVGSVRVIGLPPGNYWLDVDFLRSEQHASASLNVEHVGSGWHFVESESAVLAGDGAIDLQRDWVLEVQSCFDNRYIYSVQDIPDRALSGAGLGVDQLSSNLAGCRRARSPYSRFTRCFAC